MRNTALLTVLGALLLIPFAYAGDDEQEREIKAAQKRVKEMRQKAEELEKRGSHEDARELRAEAEKLQGRISAAKARWKSGRKEKKAKKGDDLHRIMNDLEAGMRGLRKLGGHKELLAHLKRVAVNLSEEMAQRKRKHRGANKEVEAAKHHLELMRYSMRAFLKYKKRDAAELMEHAIHAQELRLKGRRDEKAVKVYRTAPKTGAMVELLGAASELLADMGKKDTAHAVAKLRKQYKIRWEREQKGRGGERERGRERERKHREEDRGAHMERVMERVEKLEKRLDEIAGLLERMLKERDRDR